MVNELFKDRILIRPPVEAYSVLIGVTEGCAWGKCKFCGVYDGKTLIQEYRIRPWETIKQDIDDAVSLRGKHASRFFLAGGNALSAPMDLLVRVLDYLNEKFSNLEQVSAYAKNHDILKKKKEDLKLLATKGLKIVYMGLESGSAAVLRYMDKGTTPKGMIRAAEKIKTTGIALSVYVILGLGGKKFPDHAIETAKVLSKMDPDYIRFRSMNFIPNSFLYDEWRSGEFKEFNPADTINEQLNIIQNLSPDLNAYVLNDHVSNFVSIQGRLPRDREKFIEILTKAANDPAIRGKQHKNRTSM